MLYPHHHIAMIDKIENNLFRQQHRHDPAGETRESASSGSKVGLKSG
jgi:hypothetical protein